MNVATRHMEIYMYLFLYVVKRYTDISMYVFVYVVTRYMKISLVLVTRYTEIFMFPKLC